LKPENLDTVARAMAAARTRRGLIAAFVGGLATVALGAAARPAAGQMQSCTEDSQCPPNERCAGGVCVGGLVPYASATPSANPQSDPQRCLANCYANATACNDGCNGVAWFVRGRCWQICRSRQFYCVGSCPPPPPPQDDSQDS
jgi:hypothetical protein